MAPAHPILIDIPVPIRTPRLLIRPKQPGDGALTYPALQETWDELHQWMQWAENREAITAETLEIRYRQMTASFILREVFEFIGIETSSGQAVVWCGLHEIDWQARQCETGYWVRKSAHGQGIATEAANAMLRFAFGPLAMRRVGLTHSAGNEASRRIAQRLGFSLEGIQQAANLLPGGRFADRYCYARLDTENLPALDVHWGEPAQSH
jgi:RimJ/RimL family protein N-acetyltransferase